MSTNTTHHQQPSRTMGVSIGGDDSDQEVPPYQQNSCTVEIAPNQFSDDSEEETKEMGTDYDPPTRQSDYQMSADTLKMLEKEMGISLTGTTDQQNQGVVPQTKENKQSGKEEEKVSKRKSKLRYVDKRKRPDDWNDPNRVPNQEGHELVKVKHNEEFVKYYQQIGILPANEWDAFYARLKEPLDICFRINSVDQNFEKVRQEIEKQIKEMEAIPAIANKIPQLLKWYPSQLAYTFHELSRADMRQNPQLKNFHQFLIQETEMGRIFRQEAVSMIPVTLLNIEPHNSVIDMCAAPGSKTIQILEYLHSAGEKIPKGFVIANDTDQKRAYLLTHQARRLNSSTLFITNNDARRIPNLKIDPDNKSLKFDRILCDVPCSGDGTLRKNYSLWKNFNSHMGHATHPLQLDILCRAFQMLKKGGRLVYSTCSFNPIENEAVVAAALARHIKQIELVDVSKDLSPHLKYRPGMINWKIYHKGKGSKEPPMWYENFEQVPNWKRKVVKETMFTDPYTQFNNEPDRTDDLKSDPLNLRRCLRIFPHDCNQGGFFVAVFTKILDNEEEGFIYDDMYQMNAWDDPRVRQKPILQDLREFATEYEATLKKHEEDNNIPKDESTQNEIMKMVEDAEKEREQVLKAKGIKFGKMSEQVTDHKEDLFTYAQLIKEKMDVWMNIQMFYGINGDFPSENLYFQKDTSNAIVFLGDGLAQLMKYKRKYKLKVVNIGVKLFGRNRDDRSIAKYRLMQEGLEILMPFMDDRRKYKVSKDLFLKFLDVAQLTYDQLKLEHNCNVFENQEHGSGVIVYEDEVGIHAATVWIGVNTVALMIGKEEIKSLRFLIK